LRYFKTDFEDENGHRISGDKITGFIHTCRKAILQYCFCCMKDIVKGDQYIDFYSQLMGKERSHLKCYDFGEEGRYLAIKQKVNRTWIVRLFTNETKIPILSSETNNKFITKPMEYKQ